MFAAILQMSFPIKGILTPYMIMLLWAKIFTRHKRLSFFARASVRRKSGFKIGS
jgi:hypothetical protein